MKTVFKHAYETSLKQNIKWFIKRTILGKNDVDASIEKYLQNVIVSNVILKKGLNIDCKTKLRKKISILCLRVNLS